jgi:hypothetical protein
MRGYAKVASVGLLMMGLLAIPNLSPAIDGSSNRDGDGRHRLLNAELRSKVEHLRDKLADHREHQHHDNQGGIPGSLQALQTEVANLKTALDLAKAQLSSLAADLSILKKNGTGGSSVDPVLIELAKYVKVDAKDINGLKGPHVIFHHANVHVESGYGTTFEAGGLTGLGNLIVGYNEEATVGSRVGSGSHNLVVGPFHTFNSRGGVVFGERNMISAQSASVLGGIRNQAGGDRSSILGTFGYTILTTQPETTFP